MRTSNYRVFRGHIPAIESTNADVHFPNIGWLRVGPAKTKPEDGKNQRIGILVTAAHVEERFLSRHNKRTEAEWISFTGLAVLEQTLHEASGELSRSGTRVGTMKLKPLKAHPKNNLSSNDMASLETDTPTSSNSKSLLSGRTIDLAWNIAQASNTAFDSLRTSAALFSYSHSVASVSSHEWLREATMPSDIVLRSIKDITKARAEFYLLTAMAAPVMLMAGSPFELPPSTYQQA